VARVPFVEESQLGEPARTLVAGHPINLYRTLAHSEGGFASFADIGQWVRYKSTMDPREREMVILSVGVLEASEYEFSHHVKVGRDFGLSDADITGVIAEATNGSSELSERERLLIRAAREMTVDGALSNDCWEALTPHYSVEKLVEIVLIIAHYNCVTRVLKSLEIDVEPAYQGFLHEFPLPAK